MQIQMDMMKGLKALGDSVQPVLFTDEPFYQHLCDVSDGALLCSSNFESNSYHMPYVRSFIQALESLPISCSFYGYVNGDIVFHSNITAVLKGVISLIRERKLKERVILIRGGLWKGARDGTENEHLRLQHALHLIECGGERPQHREGCDEGSSFPRGRFGECVWWR